MEQQIREEPTQEFSVKVEEGKVYSVSTETYPYEKTDGYNAKVIRMMNIQEGKLTELIEGIEKDLKEYPTEIKTILDELEAMNKELDEIKESKYWSLVKDNWEEFSKIFGGIQKESKLFAKENELKVSELRKSTDEKTLINYNEVLAEMKKND